jgi:hypothetical protein
MLSYIIIGVFILLNFYMRRRMTRRMGIGGGVGGMFGSMCICKKVVK